MKRVSVATLRRGAVALMIASLCYFLFDHLLLLGLDLWVGRFPHGTIELLAFDEAGNRLSGVDVFRTWRPGLIVRDPQGSPVFGVQYGLSAARIAIPPAQPVSVEMLWPVSGFGKVMVAANNEGRGYRVNLNQELTIELLPEFARSRMFQVRQWIEKHNSGRCASALAGGELESAARLIREMDAADSPQKRAPLAIAALRLELKAGEEEVMAESRATIAKFRRGDLLIRVENADGRPVRDAKITATQQRFDFLFGVFSDGYDAVRIAKLKAMGLNYAILFMTWNRTEPNSDVYSFDQFDKAYDPAALRENGFTLCSHAMVWLARGEVPEYVTSMRGKPDQLEAAVRRRVATIVGRYKDKIQIWEAMNEGHPEWSRWDLDDASLVRLAKASADEIRKQAPDSHIMVEVTLPLGEDVALKYYPMISIISLGRIGARSAEAYEYVNRLNRAGVPYDILAIQDYNGAWVDVAGGIQVPAIDLFRFASELDRYSKLGKPIQIAEIAVGSSDHGGRNASWWHARSNEQTQADYLEGAFTIAYGNLHVEGINWWGLDDNYRFVEEGGLLDRSLRPKAAATRLTNLLKGWRTNGQLETGVDGSALFEGTPGDYRITAKLAEGQVLSADGHIIQGATNSVVLRIPGANPHVN
ncbi:MAG TPA: endo-1,4-beta-xylanase [Candidatus Binataceae bacterium]|nr:endo-1,4-beta-xylanase [Candidatus Binataceae bacterium]